MNTMKLNILKNILLFVLSINFFISCISNDKKLDSTVNTIKIKDKDLDNPICISETKTQYFKSFYLIQLESDTNMLIGHVDKIILNDDRIYVVDSRVTYSIFIFNRQGKFINKIANRGQGNEEYINIRDAFFDYSEKTINILSWSGSKNRFKIMSFDYNGNKLLKQIPIDLNFDQVLKAKDEFYVFNAKNSTNLPNVSNSILVYSNTFKKIYEGIPIPIAWRNRPSSAVSNLFENFNGDIYCTANFETDVYKLGTDSLLKLYHYDVGKYTYPEEFRIPKISEEMVRNFQINNYITNINYFYEKNDYIISVFLYNGSYKMAFYNKSTQNTTLYLLLNNPLYKGPFGNFECISDGCVISSVSANALVRLFKEPSILGKEATDELKSQFKYPIREDDNPILYIYEFAF